MIKSVKLCSVCNMELIDYGLGQNFPKKSIKREKQYVISWDLQNHSKEDKKIKKKSIKQKHRNNKTSFFIPVSWEGKEQIKQALSNPNNIKCLVHYLQQ